MYEPKLPDGVSLPPGFKVDTSDARYKALHDLATREKLSQSAFSQILGVEAQRVNADYERARATPAAPAALAPAAKPDFAKMSLRRKGALGAQQSKARLTRAPHPPASASPQLASPPSARLTARAPRPKATSSRRRTRSTRRRSARPRPPRLTPT